MTELDWLHFTTHPPKRKRAELVCVICHSKKIKCDLQGRGGQGYDNCTNCATSNRDCRVRPSKREKRRRPARAEDSLDSSIGPFDAPDTHDVLPAGMVVDPDLTDPPVAFQPLPPPSNTSPAQLSQASNEQMETTEAHLGDVDSGFLQVYGPENEYDAENQALFARLEHNNISDPLQPELQQSFIETYFEYCYSWCPVLDRDTLADELARSPLLANALALAGSHIQPPLVPHDGPAAYYKKARTMFYDDEESDGVTSLKAIALFYWWAPRPPTIVHRHATWWWTSVLIRHAQQMDIHREPGPDHPRRERLNHGLRRRIWWTAFARERLTALCQSKPCIIDPDDCNIQEPTLADFPSNPQDQSKGEIFIYWVRLCAIIGRIAKNLSRSSAKSSSPTFPVHLRQELIDWVNSLPIHLQLPIGSARTESFNRDVHQLHLPYLTTIIILHLKRSAHSLPQALPPAILAASCTARILRDILSRGNTRFLMAITCWHTGTAFIALLQACRIEHLSKDANQDLDVLVHTVKQLQNMWASANVIRGGFDRLREPYNPTASTTSDSRPEPSIIDQAHANHHDHFDWMAFFPFLTSSTSGIAAKLLSDREHGTATRGFPSPDNELFHETLMAQYQDLFDPFTDYNLDLSSVAFNP